MIEQCICQSGRRFKQCCGRFLQGDRYAKTPVQLMRSRYSAFALGGYGEYLLATWLPQSAVDYSAAELSMKSTQWTGLEIVSKSQQGNEGSVEFKVSYLNGSEKKLHHETSIFRRISGK